MRMGKLTTTSQRCFHPCNREPRRSWNEHLVTLSGPQHRLPLHHWRLGQLEGAGMPQPPTQAWGPYQEIELPYYRTTLLPPGLEKDDVLSERSISEYARFMNSGVALLSD